MKGDFSNYSQVDLEKELLTLDYHGKEVKLHALGELMRRMYQKGLNEAEAQINFLTSEIARMNRGQELAQLRAHNLRLTAQINDNAAKRIKSLNSFNT